MDQIELLENELTALLDNLQRIKQFKKDNEDLKWTPYKSNVMGEVRHRSIALKQRLSLVCKLTTGDLFKK